MPLTLCCVFTSYRRGGKRDRAPVCVVNRSRAWSRASPRTHFLSEAGALRTKLALLRPTAANQCAQRGVKETRARRTPVGSQEGGHRSA